MLSGFSEILSGKDYKEFRFEGWRFSIFLFVYYTGVDLGGFLIIFEYLLWDYKIDFFIG